MYHILLEVERVGPIYRDIATKFSIVLNVFIEARKILKGFKEVSYLIYEHNAKLDTYFASAMLAKPNIYFLLNRIK